jgi:hypothetical protein
VQPPIHSNGYRIRTEDFDAPIVDFNPILNNELLELVQMHYHCVREETKYQTYNASAPSNLKSMKKEKKLAEIERAKKEKMDQERILKSKAPPKGGTPNTKGINDIPADKYSNDKSNRFSSDRDISNRFSSDKDSLSRENSKKKEKLNYKDLQELRRKEREGLLSFLFFCCIVFVQT